MNLINLLALDKSIILYRKELNFITRKVTATILLQQIIYWHSKMNGPFYKFIEPSKNNPAYKEGDSWCEELGFSVKEFRTAYKILEDLAIVSNRTNMQRVTTYTLHVEILSQFLAGIYVNAETEVTQTPEGNLPSAETEVTQTPKGELDITETTTETTTYIGGDTREYLEYRLSGGGIYNPDGLEITILRNLADPDAKEFKKFCDWQKIKTNSYLKLVISDFVSFTKGNRVLCKEIFDDYKKNFDRKDLNLVFQIAFYEAKRLISERSGKAA